MHKAHWMSPFRISRWLAIPIVSLFLISGAEAQKAATLDPKLPLVHFLLGELYLYKSRAPEAIAEFEKEIALNPAHAATYYRLADAYSRVQKYDEAESLLLSAYEGLKRPEGRYPAAVKPRLKETLERIVQLYEETRRSDQAILWQGKLSELDKKEADLKKGLELLKLI